MMLRRLFLFFKKSKKEEAPKEEEAPSISGAFKLVDEALRKIEIAGSVLSQTPDFDLLPGEHKSERLKVLRKYYQGAEFQTSSLRDELLLTLQALPKPKKQEHK